MRPRSKPGTPSRILAGDQWQRTGFRSDGAQFTVESFARYFIHDPVHHYYDVTGSKVSAG